MAEETISKNLSYIDESIFITALLCYTIWRIKNKFNIIKLLKLHLRETAIFLLLTSTIMSFVYNLCVAYLSNYYDIEKYNLEKLGHFDGVHNVLIGNRTIDIIAILNYSLSISVILKMSTLFMLISLWLPCAKIFMRNDNIFSNNNSDSNFKTLDLYTRKSVSQASIITFSVLYAYIRIPVCVLLDLNWNYAPEKTMVFYRSVFFGSEIYMGVLFFLILVTRFLSQNSKKPVQMVNLLITLMTVDGFIRYYINIINIPVELNSLTIHVLNKVGFLTQIGISLLMVDFLCPLETQIYESKSAGSKVYLDEKPKDVLDNGNGIVLANEMVHEYPRTSIIEFGDYNHEMLHSK